MCKNLEKQEALTEVVFDLLASKIHEKTNFHYKFVQRGIANALYDMSPKYYSGLISADARKLLEEGKVQRKELCKEHPYPRTRTAKELISTFDVLFGKVSNTEIKQEFNTFIERGSKVHMVLTPENQRLYPYQQDYSLTEEEIYEKAGVVLVPDDLKGVVLRFEYEGKKYETIDSISKDLNVSKYRVEKMIKNGDIKKL